MAQTNTGQIAVPASWLGAITRMRAWRTAARKRVRQLDRARALRAAGVPIGPAERILGTAHDTAGSLVAVTTAAIYLPAQTGPSHTWLRLGWESIYAVRWDQRRGTLALAGLLPGGIWREEVSLAAGGTMVAAARERVTATRLAGAMVRLDDQVRAQVMARRQPGTGKLVWDIVLNGPADLTSPAIMAKLHGAIFAIQEAAGLPRQVPSIR